MSLLSQLRTKLTSDGVVDGSTWSCFIGYLPPDPDRVVHLVDIGGFPTDTHAEENRLPTFSVLVRGERLGYEAARTKWDAVFNSINNAESSLYSSGYAMVHADQTGPNVTWDENERPILTANFRAVHSALAS